MTESKTSSFATIAATPFTEAERAAVYRAIYERRDMRHFAGGKVADEVLLRLLRAAHHAPSVGFMQPWRFIRITRPELRERYAYDLHQCDYQTLVQEAYTPGCMMRRNRYMVDASRILIAAFDGRPGGTARTLEYAARRRLEIIQIPIDSAPADEI